MKPKVSIIILNWNGWRDTIECLESLYQITYLNYDVIVVDNGSEDESIEKIKEYCKGKARVESKFFEYSDKNKPIKIIEYTREEAEAGGGKEKEISDLPLNKKLILIKNEKNYGFAEGNNVGMRFTLDVLKSDYVLLLNNDTVVDTEFLGELVKIAESEKKVGLVQPKLLHYSDLTIDNTGILCDVFGAVMHRGVNERDKGQYDNLIENGFFYADGACIIIKKSLLTELKEDCFDKYLFAYHEDVDLSWKARLLDFKVIYCPKSICYHKGGRTSGGHNPKTAYWLYRNRVRVLIKNYSIKNLIWILPACILLKCSLLSLGSIYHRDFRYLNSFLKGLGWNLRNIKSTMEMRRYIQSRRIVGDREVMKYMECYSLELKSLLKIFIKFSALINFTS